eukprot:598278-Hanusia_phi.AAC.5
MFITFCAHSLFFHAFCNNNYSDSNQMSGLTSSSKFNGSPTLFELSSCTNSPSGKYELKLSGSRRPRMPPLSRSEIGDAAMSLRCVAWLLHADHALVSAVQQRSHCKLRR